MHIAWNIGISSLEQGFLLGIVALGVVVAFRFLDFPDLTVDGSFVTGAAIASYCISHECHPIFATLLAVPCGALAGTATGLIHTKLGVGKLLSGILMMTMLYSVNLRIMGRSNIPLIDHPTVLSGVEHSALLTIAVLATIAIALLFALTWLLRTELGTTVRAVGESEIMLSGLGISVNYVKICGLVVTNMCVALAGALFAQHQGYCDITMGIGTILAALAAIVLGEAFLRPTSPGRALLAGLVGALIYQFLITLSLYLGLPPTDLKLATGLLLIGALVVRGKCSDDSLDAVARRY